VELKDKLVLIVAVIAISSISFGEMGVWVVRDMITSPASIDEIVYTAEQLGIDRLYVQVVGRADAFYKSDILPRSHLLKSAPKDFDPLGYLLEKVKGTGIKVSAWMNVFYAWSFSSRPEDPMHVLNQHPDWVTYDEKGYSMFEYNKAPDVTVPGIFLDPGVDEVKRFVASVAEEIAKKYDVDEIHLDYIRYPYRTFGYNPTVMRKFRKWTRKALKEGKIKSFAEASFDDFRREQVNETVRLIYEKVKKYGKKISAAVYPYYPNAHDDVLQDWPAWIKGGYLDFAVLMAYDPDPLVIKSYIDFYEKMLGSLKKIRIGLGLYKVNSDPELLRNLLKTAKSGKPNEIVVFSYKFLNETSKNVLLSFTKH